MIESLKQGSYDPGKLLTYLAQTLSVKNDRALSRALKVSCALLVAIREQKLAITGAVLMQIG